MPGSSAKGPMPVMRIFGVTESGNSVMAHVHGFAPYFYIRAPNNFTPKQCKDLLENLNSKVVLAVELVNKQTVYGYQRQQSASFIKIILCLPHLIPIASKILTSRNFFGPHFDAQCFESNIAFVLRFMVDFLVVGCSWIELPSGSYEIRPESQCDSRCQLEVDIAYNKFISHEPEGKWSNIAPLRVLSFDIKCAGRKGIFPDPDQDSIIQIANYVIRQGESEPFIRVIFCLGQVSPIVDVEVKCFNEERKLIDAWASSPVITFKSLICLT